MVDRSDGFPDVDILHAADCNQIPCFGTLDFQPVQAKETEQLGHSEVFDGAVLFHEGYVLSDFDLAAEYAPDTDTANIIVVIKQCNLELQRLIAVIDRRRYVLDDHIIYGLHVLILSFCIEACRTVHSRCICNREFKLFVIGVKLNEKFQYFIDNFLRTCGFLVDLVEHDKRFEILFQRLFQHETCLWHCALVCIDDEDDTIHHFHDTLDRKSTRLNSSHVAISYAVFCLKKKKYKTKREI